MIVGWLFLEEKWHTLFLGRNKRQGLYERVIFISIVLNNILVVSWVWKKRGNVICGRGKVNYKVEDGTSSKDAKE